MALDSIQQTEFNNALANDMKSVEQQFKDHKNALQSIFDKVQAYIDNPDTPTVDPADWVTILEGKKASGKTVIQNMLDGIT